MCPVMHWLALKGIRKEDSQGASRNLERAALKSHQPLNWLLLSLSHCHRHSLNIKSNDGPKRWQYKIMSRIVKGVKCHAACKQVANHSFTDAGRWHKIPGQKQRTLLLVAQQAVTVLSDHSTSDELNRRLGSCSHANKGPIVIVLFFFFFSF